MGGEEVFDDVPDRELVFSRLKNIDLGRSPNLQFHIDRKEFFISKSGVWVVPETQGARNQMDRFCSALNQLQWNLDITNNFLCPSTGKIYEKGPQYNKTLL